MFEIKHHSSFILLLSFILPSFIRVSFVHLRSSFFIFITLSLTLRLYASSFGLGATTFCWHIHVSVASVTFTRACQSVCVQWRPLFARTVCRSGVVEVGPFSLRGHLHVVFRHRNSTALPLLILHRCCCT